MPTAQDIYCSTVLPLPASERLRLATLILEDLTKSSASTLDFADHWTEDDVQDITAFSAKYASDALEEE